MFLTPGSTKDSTTIAKKVSFVGFCICFCLSSLHGQQFSAPDKNQIIENRIELIAENIEGDDIDYTTLFDELSYFYDHPINLNNTSVEKLQQLNMLNDFQIFNLFTYISKYGKLLSIYELQAIPGFDEQTIELILPFISTAPGKEKEKITMKNISEFGGHEVFLRYQQVLETQEGFAPIDDSLLKENPDQRYLGSPAKIYTRYRFRFQNKISLGITAEKDPGEEFFKGSQPAGFDFYSAHFYLRNIGRIKHLAIGDYHVQFGQGLTFWSGMAFGKSADANNIRKYPAQIRPYASADENLFMRGAATTVELHQNFELTAFYSSKKIDANRLNLTDTMENTPPVVSSLQVTGFHRTPAEVEDKDAIRETNYGSHLRYIKPKFSLGITATRTLLRGELERSLSAYNRFEFNKNNNSNIGADYSYVLSNFNFFGEAALSENGGMAVLNGVMVNVGPINLSVINRNYQRNYQSLHSAGFGEGSKNANEHGTYLGITAKPVKYITVFAYFDRFRFPWLRYQVDAPSEGAEYLTQVNYNPSRRLQLYIRYRQEIKSRNTVQPGELTWIIPANKQNLRMHLNYSATTRILLRSRAEFTRFSHDSEISKGSLLFQDIIYKSIEKPFTAIFRFALFDTESFDSRVYACEHDMLYVFSIPAYFGRGMRTYATIKYQARKGIDIWFRLGQTYWSDRQKNGSALNTINKPTRTELKAQVRLKF